MTKKTLMTTAPAASLRRKITNMSKARGDAVTIETKTLSREGTKIIRLEVHGTAAESFEKSLHRKIANMSKAWKHIVFGVIAEENNGGRLIEVALTPAHKIAAKEE